MKPIFFNILLVGTASATFYYHKDPRWGHVLLAFYVLMAIGMTASFNAVAAVSRITVPRFILLNDKDQEAVRNFNRSLNTDKKPSRFWVRFGAVRDSVICVGTIFFGWWFTALLAVFVALIEYSYIPTYEKAKAAMIRLDIYRDKNTTVLDGKYTSV